MRPINLAGVAWTSLNLVFSRGQVCHIGYQEVTHTLVGCSMNESFVGIWTIALDRVQPWRSDKAHIPHKVSGTWLDVHALQKFAFQSFWKYRGSS